MGAPQAARELTVPLDWTTARLESDCQCNVYLACCVLNLAGTEADCNTSQPVQASSGHLHTDTLCVTLQRDVITQQQSQAAIWMLLGAIIQRRPLGSHARASMKSSSGQCNHSEVPTCYGTTQVRC
jgi:hypothetical protein